MTENLKKKEHQLSGAAEELVTCERVDNRSKHPHEKNLKQHQHLLLKQLDNQSQQDFIKYQHQQHLLQQQ